MNNEKVIDISWMTIFRISIAVVIFYVLYQIRDILIWFVLALIISILFDPIINFLSKLRIPRPLAVCSAYSIFFGLLVLLIYFSVPFFISEMQDLSKALPQYFEKFSPLAKKMGIEAFKNINVFIDVLKETSERMINNISNVLFIIFGGVFTTIFILTTAIFLSMEEKGIEKALVLFFPKRYEKFVISLWEICQKKVNDWFFIRILGCIFVGLVSFITFIVFNIPYSFILGLLAGILNFIPFVGPFITGVLIFTIVSVENISKAVFLIIIFILIQQIENNIITPLLSKKFVGIPPVLVLISFAIGGTIWGFLGAILVIPFVGILFEFIKKFLKRKEIIKKEDDGHDDGV